MLSNLFLCFHNCCPSYLLVLRNVPQYSLALRVWLIMVGFIDIYVVGLQFCYRLCPLLSLTPQKTNLSGIFWCMSKGNNPCNQSS